MKRIQRKRLKGWKKPVNSIYIGRPSIFGNPFLINEKVFQASPCMEFWAEDKFSQKDLEKYGENQIIRTVDEAIRLYKEYILPEIPKDILNQLKGKTLMCWCSLNEPCHGDVIIDYLEGLK